MKPQKVLQMRRLILALALVLLSGCATVSNPIPQGYSGPEVLLDDSGYPEGTSKARLFAALEIDGRPIQNALRETRMASHGQGFSLSPRYTIRNVPVLPMKIRIIGTHQTAAPIHEMASRMAGTFYSVEGIVDFKPVEGRRYMVTGDLEKERSCVWIAELGTAAVVTEKVCTK